MRLLTAACLLMAAPVLAQTTPADPSIGRRIRADVEFLASDKLEGRDTGSRGHAIAADYVASQFRAIGLEPAARREAGSSRFRSGGPATSSRRASRSLSAASR